MSDNLYERNGIWWFKVQIAGVPYRRSLRTRSRPLARKLAAAEIEKIKAFAVSGEQRHLYKEAVLRWTKEFLPSKEAATSRRYLSSARQLSPFFSSLYIDQIRPATIAAYVSHRKAESATDMTIRRDLTALSSILRNCVSWGWTDTNAAKLWDRSTLKESRLAIHRVDQATFDMVRKEAPPALAALMVFLLETGARLEEAASLTRRQLKANNRVYLEKTKTHHPRTIALSPPAAKAIQSQPIDIASDYVFNHGHREPLHIALEHVWQGSGAGTKTGTQKRHAIPAVSASTISAMNLPPDGSRQAVASMISRGTLATIALPPRNASICASCRRRSKRRRNGEGTKPGTRPAVFLVVTTKKWLELAVYSNYKICRFAV
jgi:integrase/recombinase XerD